MGLQVITANNLDDGLVVFLGADKSWVNDINQALLLDTEIKAEETMSEMDHGEFPLQVVGPYLIDVEKQDGAIVPLKYRERIRTLGPTVRTDLGYQAGQ